MTLLKWALVCLVIAGIAALLGYSGLAEGAATIAQVLVGIFLVIAVVLGIFGVIAYRKVT